MGESYLHMKILNKMRRSKTTTLQQPINLADEVVASCSSGQKATDNCLIEDENISSPSPAPQLIRETNKMIRESSSESNLIDRTTTTTTKITSKSWLHKARNNVEQHHLVPSSGKTTSRLRSASKAILFFRRAASNLTPKENRPTTTTMIGQTNSLIDSTGSADTTASNHQSQDLLPHFIVPKMNSLKLPLVCFVRSLEGELMREVFVHRYEIGQYLIESLKVSIGLKDSKYFGLRLAKSLDEQEDLQNPWLDLNESIWKQIKSKQISNLVRNYSTSSETSQAGTRATTTIATNNLKISSLANRTSRSIDFYLRIKFYPPNLARVQDTFLRQYLWKQLRRDLRLGKLTSSMNNLTFLMACILQYEFGDYRDDLVDKIEELNILPNQDIIEEQAIIIWRDRLIGTIRHQTQMKFLRAAVILETYGFDYYPVRDHQRQRAFLLGFNYAGIKTIRNGRIVHHFRWHNLSKISYERRMIIFHIYPLENSKRKNILGFKCLSNEDCQNLYLRLLEQKYFFTVDLAYFDKSIRRPTTCLYTATGSGEQLDWGTNNNNQFGDDVNDYEQEEEEEEEDPSNLRLQVDSSNGSSFARFCQNDDDRNVSSPSLDTCAPDEASLAGATTWCAAGESGSGSGNRDRNKVKNRNDCLNGSRMSATNNSSTSIANSKGTSSLKEPACIVNKQQSSGWCNRTKTTALSSSSLKLERQQSTSRYKAQLHLQDEASDEADNENEEEEEEGSKTNNRIAHNSSRSKQYTSIVLRDLYDQALTSIPRLMQLTESILIQPASATVNWTSRELSRGLQVGISLGSTVRLCLFILLLNLVFKATNNISTTLIDLLTIDKKSPREELELELV